MEEEKKINVHQIFWYFVLFSMLGLAIETLYARFTMGIWESRKGFIWGPFCPIYGVGGTCLIILLNKVDKKNYFKLFILGYLIGSVVEYLLSYCIEAIYGARFWDYSCVGKDINGRICLLYSLFWGFLTIGMMRFVKPRMDKLVNKISGKIKWPIEIAFALFLLIDMLVTIWSINTYENRAIATYYNETIETKNNNSIISKIENDYFTNERMEKTFPNLRTKDRESNQVYVRDLLKNNP